MIVKKTIGRVALALAALGLVSGVAVWTWTSSSCPADCPPEDCGGAAATAETEPAKAAEEAPKTKVAQAPPEVRRLRSKMRTGAIIERSNQERKIVVEKPEPNEDSAD